MYSKQNCKEIYRDKLATHNINNVSESEYAIKLRRMLREQEAANIRALHIKKLQSDMLKQLKKQMEHFNHIQEHFNKTIDIYKLNDEEEEVW